MSLFKKAAKPAIKSSDRSIAYPIEIKFWNDHYEAITKLLNDAEIDLNTLKVSGYANAKLVPEPDNEFDPNAIQVFAAAKGRGKTYYPIGYVSADDNILIRPDIKKVVAGTHYWSLRIRFDVRDALQLTLYLKESKFK